MGVLERRAEATAAYRTILEMRTQYRCHPILADVASRLFYGGRLKSGISAESRMSVLGPGTHPLTVLITRGCEERIGQSFQHREEAVFCATWVQRCVQMGVSPDALLVLCLYRAQAAA